MSSVWDSLVSNSQELAKTAGNAALSSLLQKNLQTASPSAPQTPTAPAADNSGMKKYLVIGGIVLLAVVGFMFFRKK